MFNQQNSVNDNEIKQLIEAALFVSDKALTIEQLQQMLATQQLINKKEITALVNELITDYQHRGVELVKVASGFRFQAKAQFSLALNQLFQEKAPKYSRALLETLALVAYRQPITRGEIEAVRGVALSSHIMKTLLERDWLKVVGHKEVPGRPSLYGTTKTFLDYFSLDSLTQLPPLAIEKAADGEKQITELS
jgi:segregation and condensation protein B